MLDDNGNYKTDTGKIGFIIDKREVTDGHVKLSIRMLNSSKPMGSTRELPIILNALKANSVTNPQVNRGFTYTFPFGLSQGHGFPYLLDFSFEDRGMLTLV